MITYNCWQELLSYTHQQKNNQKERIKKMTKKTINKQQKNTLRGGGNMQNIKPNTIVSSIYNTMLVNNQKEKQDKLASQKASAKSDPNCKNAYYKQLALKFINNDNDGLQALYTLVKSQVTRTLVRFASTSDYGYRLYKASRKHLDDPTQIDRLHHDIKDLIHSGILYMLEYVSNCKQDNLHIDYNQLIKVGYQGINKHLISSQGISIKLGAYNFSLEKMLENGCDLTIKQGIASIFNQNKYNYIPLKIDFTPNQKLMLQAIKSVLVKQSLYTNRVLYFYCLGDSVRQVATRLNRSSTSIQYQIDKIRKLCFDKYNQYLNN